MNNNNTPIDIKTLTIQQLEAAYLQLSVQTRLDNRMLELLLNEMIEKQQSNHAPLQTIKLPKLQKIVPTEPIPETGSFNMTLDNPFIRK
jgi:hypothetical protein